MNIMPLIWGNIAEDSFNFEKNMDALNRKRTGSYYTSLDLTLQMMQSMIQSLDVNTQSTLYSKKFLEPCVGTGNFVFAYLEVCKNLHFTKDQYKALINNIFVCDINEDALEIYKKNFSQYVLQEFDYELPDDYFATHIGSALLFDVSEENISYIPIESVFPADLIGTGFDFVVTNPPYKNLKAERSQYTNDIEFEADKKKYSMVSELSGEHFQYSTSGTLNLYKLFVEEIIDKYASSTGICSLLIPSSILSDKSCTALRTWILKNTSIKSLKLITEDSYVVDASQALCALLLHKGDTTTDVIIEGSITGQISKPCKMNVADFLDDKTGNAILLLTQNEYSIRKKMLQYPCIKDLSYIHNLRGELDLTLNKKSIVTEETDYLLLRGRNISSYQIINNPNEYVSSEFVQHSSKQKYINQPRLICQQIANMSKKHRVCFALAPRNIVLGNSCNFIAVDDNTENVSLLFLLGILNSSIIDWFFKLTSSNNHINNYEIDNFPIPTSSEYASDIECKVQEYIDKQDNSILQEIDRLVNLAYGVTIMEPSKVSNSDYNQVANNFFNDISQIVEDFTLDNCLDILNGNAAIEDLLLQKKTNVSKFDKKVVLALTDKYIKMQHGIVLNHTTFKLSDLDLEMIKSVPQGGSWKDIPAETVCKSKRLERITQTGGRTTLYGRIDYSKPSYTITTYFNRPGNGTYVHPIHERVISVREAARFQSFPDQYYFYGNKSDMLKQVGNAVPVIMAYNIGKSIIEKTGCSTSVDLFSGAGGMTYGFKLSGIKAVISNDFVENACVTLKTNSPEIPVLCGDVTDDAVKSSIIKAGIEAKADIICGGPPCQGFSLAGYRSANDPRNELFKHFVDIVSVVNPKVIVFENVEGLLSYQGGETYRNIIQLFSDLGYNCEGRSLFASDFGVPQKRKRVIILCTRKDLNILPTDIFPHPITPNEDKQISAYETIYDLENVYCSETANYNSTYSSPILEFFKGNISADTYIETVRDSRILENQNQLSDSNDNIQLSFL